MREVSACELNLRQLEGIKVENMVLKFSVCMLVREKARGVSLSLSLYSSFFSLCLCSVSMSGCKPEAKERVVVSYQL